MPAPVTPQAAQAQVRRKYERSFGTWATGSVPEPLLELPLHPPTERSALEQGQAVIEWVKSWDNAPGVVWGERRWASLGRQRVPERLVLPLVSDAAAWCGRSAHWRRVRERTAAVLNLAGDAASPTLPAVVGRAAGELEALPADDVERLIAVLDWLGRHPESGLYLRQLPIGGVDTKWVQRHRGLVERLHQGLTGYATLGLAGAPQLMRLRFLDRRWAPGGLGDVSAPPADLAALDIAPRTVFVFENLESVLAMPPWPDAVVLHGQGYAVDRLGSLPWVRSAGVLYWGDLDSHGLAILNRLRAQPLAVRTVLMDLATLDGHRHLWVPEPKPATGDFAHLHPAERETMAGLAERGNVRLEQERIPWDVALAALRSACAS